MKLWNKATKKFGDKLRNLITEGIFSNRRKDGNYKPRLIGGQFKEQMNVSVAKQASENLYSLGLDQLQSRIKAKPTFLSERYLINVDGYNKAWLQVLRPEVYSHPSLRTEHNAKVISAPRSHYEFKLLMDNLKGYMLGRSGQYQYDSRVGDIFLSWTSQFKDCLTGLGYNLRVPKNWKQPETPDKMREFLTIFGNDYTEADFLMRGIKKGVNQGYPTVDKQGASFPEDFSIICKELLDIDVTFSIYGILYAVSVAYSKGLYFPYIGFYRTQGGVGDDGSERYKHRNVFGGSWLNKAYGAIVFVLKHYGGLILEYLSQPFEIVNTHQTPSEALVRRPTGEVLIKRKLRLPIYNNVPIIMWESWDTLFQDILSQVKDTMENMLGKEQLTIDTYYQLSNDKRKEISQKYANIIGEDFTGYDTSISNENLRWMKDLLHVDNLWDLTYMYTLNSLEQGEVWYGIWRFENIYFKSGHPFTSEFGSWIHFNHALCFEKYCKENFGHEVKLEWIRVLSDDSLIKWSEGFVFSEYQEYSQAVGLKIKDSHSDLLLDGFVEALKVLVGLIGNINDKVDRTLAYIFCGNPHSRLHGLAQMERGLNDHGYEISGDDEIDALISKLASLGSAAQPVMVQVLSWVVDDREFGNAIIRTVLNIKTESGGELVAVPIDEDLVFSFHPRVVKDAFETNISLKALDKSTNGLTTAVTV